jgi:GNAT superfamily N-acetyltransferase
MTALTAASDRLAPVGLNTRPDHSPCSIDYARLEAAIERARAFWAVDPAESAQTEGTDFAEVAGWRPVESRGLMRRVARDVNQRVAAVERDRPAFVELRGARELGSAHEVLAEAYGVSVADAAPRRTILLPGPVHLRTWALFGEAAVLACAMTVFLGDIVVVCRLATHPARQGRGYATHMMHALHRLYERTGVAAEFALASSESADSLFGQLGYHPIDRIVSGSAFAGNLLRQPAQYHPVTAPRDYKQDHRMAGG